MRTGIITFAFIALCNSLTEKDAYNSLREKYKNTPCVIFTINGPPVTSLFGKFELLDNILTLNVDITA